MAKKTKRSAQYKGSRPIGEQTAKGSKNRTILWLAALAAIILVVALIFIATAGNKPAPVVSTGSSKAEEVGQPVDRRTIGSPDAPVVVQAYEDFQCPHCQQFTATLEPTIMELVKAGTVRYEYHHRFVIGPDSITAGAAAECAADQGAFWEYHDALYAAFQSNPQAARVASLKQIAADIGLDTATFNSCLDTQEHYEQMLREDNEARSKGINATPTVFINGEQYQGDFSPESFKAAVEAAMP